MSYFKVKLQLIHSSFPRGPYTGRQSQARCVTPVAFFRILRLWISL